MLTKFKENSSYVSKDLPKGKNTIHILGVYGSKSLSKKASIQYCGKFLTVKIHSSENKEEIRLIQKEKKSFEFYKYVISSTDILSNV